MGALKHFYGPKWIAGIDIRVILMFYSFQGVRADLEGELEKLTKYTQIWKYLKSMLLDFDSLYQWKNSFPPLCVINIRKHLDLLFHLVYAELVFWYENHKHIAFWTEMQISGKISLFRPQSHCKWSDIKMLSRLIQFFVWFHIGGPMYKAIHEEIVSFSPGITLLILASFRTQPGPQSDTSSYIVKLVLPLSYQHCIVILAERQIVHDICVTPR